MSGLSAADGTVTDRSVAQPRTGRRALLAVAALLLLAVGTGALWAALAAPPQWRVTEQGIVLTEEAAGRQAGVELLFVALGAGLCLLWALVVGHLLRRLGWVVVPLVVAATSVASVVAWRVGLLLGPADPASVTDPQIGDRVPAQLVVDAPASFVVWPIAGLLGVLLVTWATGRRPAISERSDPAAPR